MRPVLALLGILAACAPREPVPPSVLIVALDDLTCSAVGAFGGRVGIAPAIDRLASEGIAFREAFCASAYCTPSRQAFLTGRWPHEIGVTRVRTQLPPGSVTLGTAFRAAGYRTAAIGKMHWNRGDTRADYGFDLILDRADWRGGLDPSEARVVDQHRRNWVKAWSSGERRYRAGPLGLREERQEASWLVDRALEFVGAQPDRPFLAFCSFHQPHFPFTYPPSFESRARPEDLEPPAYEPGELERNVPGIKPGTPDGRPLEPEEARALAAAYLRSVAWVDSQVGRLLGGLELAGRADDTVVVLWSDHGFFLGEHGLVGKLQAFREIVRVPLVVRVPGRPAGARPEPVQLVDVFPTLCELTGVPAPDRLSGRSLVALIDGGEAPRDHASVLAPGRWAMVRTEAWKLVIGADAGGGLDQLYDLRADPEERTNLYGAPEHASALPPLVERLRTLLAGTPPGWTPAESWMASADAIADIRRAVSTREPDLPREPREPRDIGEQDE